MRVTITGGLLPTFLFSRKLKSMGFKKRKEKGYFFWYRHIDDDKTDKIKNIKHFCRCRLLRCMIIDDSMERSNNYRSVFLKRYKGLFCTGVYFCAYCNSPIRRSKMTVDHIVSVYNARTNPSYRHLLERLNIQNVNDIRNLAPSCFKCNRRKSSDGGLWIIRGYFGKSMVRVLLLEAVELIAGAAVLRYLYFFLHENVYPVIMDFITKYLIW